jgi:hypothetical protein
MRVRLAGVACLAFLWSVEGNKSLRQIAVEDPEPGVRQSALWAYGFANGEGAFKLASWQAKDDISSQVRSFAEKAKELNETEWWLL